MTKSLWQIDDTHHLDELSGFVTHFLRGRGRLLDQGSVPLRHIVQSPHDLIYLGNAEALLFGRLGAGSRRNQGLRAAAAMWEVMMRTDLFKPTKQ